MALKVTLNDSAWPKDTEISVLGLGFFINGKSRDITSEEEETFFHSRGMTVRDALEGSDSFKVEGTSTVTKATTGGEN